MDAAAIVELDLLRQLAIRLAEAKWGEQGKILDEACVGLRMSRATLYKRLKEAGLYAAQRKQRSDAGRTCISEDDALRAAGMLHLGTRANGKKTFTIKAATELLAANGCGRIDRDTGEILMPSPTTLARAMRKFNCHPGPAGW